MLYIYIYVYIHIYIYIYIYICAFICICNFMHTILINILVTNEPFTT